MARTELDSTSTASITHYEDTTLEQGGISGVLSTLQSNPLFTAALVVGVIIVAYFLLSGSGGGGPSKQFVSKVANKVAKKLSG